MPSHTMVGNDMDEHGCRASEGYKWCKEKGEKGKCLPVYGQQTCGSWPPHSTSSSSVPPTSSSSSQCPEQQCSVSSYTQSANFTAPNQYDDIKHLNENMSYYPYAGPSSSSSTNMQQYAMNYGSAKNEEENIFENSNSEPVKSLMPDPTSHAGTTPEADPTKVLGTEFHSKSKMMDVSTMRNNIYKSTGRPDILDRRSSRYAGLTNGHDLLRHNQCTIDKIIAESAARYNSMHQACGMMPTNASDLFYENVNEKRQYRK